MIKHMKKFTSSFVIREMKNFFNEIALYWEFGVDTHKLLYLKQITNKDLLLKKKFKNEIAL